MTLVQRSRIKILAISALAMILWLAAVIAAPILGLGGIRVTDTDSKVFIAAARSATQGHSGNLSLLLIENGKPVRSHHVSIGKPVTGDTVFQMASVSKWVAAWGVMTLVDAGRIELDAPVSRYLKRWRLPRGAYPDDQVTIRRVLSHTAGLTDDLGYCGFKPGAPLQTLAASLTKAADACPWRTGAVRADGEAGRWRYSGGGYTLLQLVVEDVTGVPFAQYMQRAVLAPLGMTRSTFAAGAPDADDLGDFFDSDGTPAPHYRYTATAAASLYSTTNDMARFLQAHMAGPMGEAPGRGVISPQSVERMIQPQAKLFGVAHWALGPQLFATSVRGGALYGHNGGNMPAISHAAVVEAATGDGIIALSTGGRNLGARLGGAWIAARRDAITPAMVAGAAQRLFNPAEALLAATWILGGWALIVAWGVWVWRRKVSRGTPAMI